MSLPKITSAMLILTHACPLACKYCFVHQEPSHMTYATAKSATEFLIANAEEQGDVPVINFFGGEPMVMWNEIIVPLTNWIRQEYKKPFNLSITTNGVLLNDERISFLKKNGINMLFSIDGAKATQDYNRPFHSGKSSFDVLEPIIPKIIENFPMTTFRMTTIPPTCANVFENVQFAKDNGFKNFFVIPNVFEEWSQEARIILQNEMRKYSEYFIDCYRAGNQPITFSVLEKSFSDIVKINKAITQKTYRNLSGCQACGKCGLGASKFASIHPNGNIYGCQEMTSNEGKESIFYIGNIFTGVDDTRRQSLMNLFDSVDAVGYNCSVCKYNRICDGGCVANNYLVNGDVNKVPEVYCWWKQILLKEAIYISQTLGKEDNPMFKQRWVKKL